MQGISALLKPHQGAQINSCFKSKGNSESFSNRQDCSFCSWSIVKPFSLFVWVFSPLWSWEQTASNQDWGPSWAFKYWYQNSLPCPYCDPLLPCPFLISFTSFLHSACSTRKEAKRAEGKGQQQQQQISGNYTLGKKRDAEMVSNNHHMAERFHRKSGFRQNISSRYPMSRKRLLMDLGQTFSMQQGQICLVILHGAGSIPATLN